MAKKTLLKGLAYTFGGGLAFGAGLKLGQTSRWPAVASHKDLVPLLGRLDAVEQRIGKVEALPFSQASEAPPSGMSHLPSVEQNLAALEARLTARMDGIAGHLGEVEASLRSQMDAQLRFQANKAEALGCRLDGIEQELRSEIEMRDRHRQEQIAGVAGDLRKLGSRLSAEVDSAVETRLGVLYAKLNSDIQEAQTRKLEAVAQGLEARLVPRIAHLEENRHAHSEAIAALREKSLATDQNMQAVMAAVEKLCTRAESPGAPPPAGEALPAGIAAPDMPAGAAEAPDEIDGDREAVELAPSEPAAPKSRLAVAAWSIVAVGTCLTGLELSRALNSPLPLASSNSHPSVTLPAAKTQKDEGRLIQQAREYASGKDWKHAEKDYRSALELNPRNREAITGLSDALFQQGKYEERDETLARLSGSR